MAVGLALLEVVGTINGNRRVGSKAGRHPLRYATTQDRSGRQFGGVP